MCIRDRCKDGTETTVLSPHSRNNLEKDAEAFCELMKILKDYDEKRETIIAVQVENEPGIFAATRRDFSEQGTAAFSREVPEDIRLLAQSQDAGSIHESWLKNGGVSTGSWKEMFGAFGAELCTAWAIASYIDEIAARGKAVRDIFMYTNVWMDRNLSLIHI